MGYTHYWERPRILPRPQFTLAVDDCRRLCAAMDIPLGDADGKGQPTFTPDEICFNGHTDSGRLNSAQRVEGIVWPHERAHGIAMVGEADAIAGGWSAGPAVSAYLEPTATDRTRRSASSASIVPSIPNSRPKNGWWSNYCKTNYRPYDLCVQGCLIVLSHHLGIEHFRVSSDGTSRDWNDARDATQHILGYGIDWGEGKLAPVPPPQPTA